MSDTLGNGAVTGSGDPSVGSLTWAEPNSSPEEWGATLGSAAGQLLGGEVFGPAGQQVLGDAGGYLGGEAPALLSGLADVVSAGIDVVGAWGQAAEDTLSGSASVVFGVGYDDNGSEGGVTEGEGSEGGVTEGEGSGGED